jgi:hypothetical protein
VLLLERPEKGNNNTCASRRLANWFSENKHILRTWMYVAMIIKEKRGCAGEVTVKLLLFNILLMYVIDI